VNWRKIIVALAVTLTVFLPYWSALPLVIGFLPAQAALGAIVYLLEVLLMIVLVMGVIDGRRKLLFGAAGLSLLLGIVPGLGVMPPSLYLPVWIKAVFPAMALGLLIDHGYGAGKSFIAASAILGAAMLLVYFQSSPALAEQSQAARANVENLVTGPMTASGYNQEAINTMVDQLVFFMRLVMRLLPGLLIMSGVGQLFLAFLLADWYFTRRDSYFPGFGPFIYWKIPEKLLYLLGAVLIIRLIAGGGAEMAADNAIFVLLVCYAVCGLSLIEHFLRRLRLPVLVRVIFYVGLTFMHIPGLIATSVAGLFDSYFDFRKVRAHTLG